MGHCTGERLGPLDGIPIAVKDNFCMQDTPTTAGSRALQGLLASATGRRMDCPSLDHGLALDRF